MLRRYLSFCGWLALLSTAGQLHAADVRYYQENGVTYRETRYKVQHPVTETVLVDQPRTVYREKLDTELRDTIHTYQVPVTTYRSEQFVLNRWNPFAKAVVAQRLVPVTQMVTRTETVKVPLTKRQIVPETTTVKVAVTRTRIVDEDITSRVAVADPPRSIAVPQSVAAQTAAPSSSTPSSIAQRSTVPQSAGTSSMANGMSPKMSTTAPTPNRYPTTNPSPTASRSTYGTAPMAGLPPTTGTTFAVQTPAAGTTGQPAYSGYGGVSNLSTDPPRTGSNYQWRPGDASMR